jgi:hypothetical protein
VAGRRLGKRDHHSKVLQHRITVRRVGAEVWIPCGGIYLESARERTYCWDGLMRCNFIRRDKSTSFFYGAFSARLFWSTVRSFSLLLFHLFIRFLVAYPFYASVLVKFIVGLKMGCGVRRFSFMFVTGIQWAFKKGIKLRIYLAIGAFSCSNLF